MGIKITTARKRLFLVITVAVNYANDKSGDGNNDHNSDAVNNGSEHDNDHNSSNDEEIRLILMIKTIMIIKMMN